MARPRVLVAAALTVGTVISLVAVSVATVHARPGAAASPAAKPRCPAPVAARAATGPSSTVEIVQAATADRPEIGMAVYPRPDRASGGSNPWSQWGQGLVLRDGRFVSGMGDHRGADGNSYLFVYEPDTRRLTRFADVLSQVPHATGEWGYGKIHAQIVAGRCGDAYVATYWGDRDDIRYTDVYRGDLLFRLDPATLALEHLGPPAPEHGISSLASSPRKGLLYGEAPLPVPPEPQREHDQGAFFVYDMRKKQVAFRSDDLEHALFRNVLVDGKGRAYVAGERGSMLMYEAGADALRRAPGVLPGGGYLRASTRPAPDGTVYGVTQDPDHLFALAPDGAIRDLGLARGYTASLALDPDGSRFFYVPGAHGDAPEQGTPIVAVDTTTGAQSVVAELEPLAEEHLGLVLGGSYNLAVSPDGTRLHLGLNAGKTRDDPWGEVVLAVVTLRS